MPARIAYALVALPIGGAVGFYGGIWVLPRLVSFFQGSDWNIDDYLLFELALGLGTGLAFTASLIALTLPWKRRRRRGGRRTRIAISCVLVVMASLSFARQAHTLLYDLIFAAWLAYTMAFTFVRYGILDPPRRLSSAGDDAASGDEGS